jgi:ABC-type oligopeptide transport system substrate-binding subunit
MTDASTIEQLRDASRALDRVVMWHFWQMPELYNSKEQASYWNKFGLPKVQARYFTIDYLNTGIVEHGPWPVRTWWDKSLERASAP